jgi:hypothetical protein
MLQVNTASNYPDSISKDTPLCSTMERIEQRPSSSSSMKRERSAVSHDAPLKDEESQVQAVRRKVTLILEHRLSSRFSDEGKDKDKDQIKKIAKCLEQFLFQSSSSFAKYSDLSTLENRMGLVLTVKLQRRLLPVSTKRNRTQILIRTLGREKFTSGQDLVREIKLEKNKKVATMKCSGRGVCCSIPFRESLPRVVRDLFFETALLDAFERSSLERIPTFDWDVLMTDAEENLRAYKVWAHGK